MISVIRRTKSEFFRLRLAAPFLVLALTLPTTMNGFPTETTVYVNQYFEVREHDQPTKHVFSGDTRVVRVTGSLSTNTRVQRLRLVPGWNLCSLAVTAATALQQITNSQSSILNSQSIFRWDPSALSWLPVAPIETLAAGTILWLHATTNTTLSLTGSYFDPTNRAIEGGGSFQSGAGLEALPLLGERAGVRADVALSSFDASDQHWQLHEPSIPFTDTAFPELLSPGEAIFMNADAPTTLEVPESALRVRYYHQDHLGSSSVMTDANGALVEETAFYPFGTQRNEHQPRQIEENYKFTQKERDQESGLQYSETRYLANGIARFISPDRKYSSPDALSQDDLALFLSRPVRINIYAYAELNPLRWIDPDGMAPGEPFASSDQAATDALLVANPQSIEANQEFGGLVYYDTKVERYYATAPASGGLAGFNPGSVTIPKGTSLVGDYHTHGDNTFLLTVPTVDVSGRVVNTQIPFHSVPSMDAFDSEHFSSTDRTGITADAAGRPGYSGYLGTPSGAFQKFDPASGVVSGLPKLEYSPTPVDPMTVFRNAAQTAFEATHRH